MWDIEAKIHKELEEYFEEIPFIVATDMYGGIELRAAGYVVHFGELELRHRREWIWGDIMYFVEKCKRRARNAPLHSL